MFYYRMDGGGLIASTDYISSYERITQQEYEQLKEETYHENDTDSATEI